MITKIYTMRILVFISILLCAISSHAQDRRNHTPVKPGATEADIIRLAANITPSKEQLRWQEMEMTAFFHFGVNTFTDREWGEGTENPKVFSPSALDARQWVKACKDAGFKQVIITAKHHDGFCLWPTKYTDHSVKNSDWKGGKGDVVKEVSDACHQLGVGFGVYLSPWDRNNPHYGDSPKYDGIFINMLTELLTNYGRVDEVWFDGACGEGPNGKKQVYNWAEYYKCIHKLAPHALIAIMGPDIRWVGTESGYGRESEWSVLPLGAADQAKIADASQSDMNIAPSVDCQTQDLGSRSKIKDAKGLIWYPAETDVSIRPGWFYHSTQDAEVKAPEKLLDIYFSSVGYNSVLLLNIPPDRRGLLNKNDVNAIKGLRTLLDKMYALNFASNAKITSNGVNEKAILDQQMTTFWTTKGEKEKGSIEIVLPKPQTIDVLCLQENITVGQRIEKFRLEYKVEDNWHVAAIGTTVGYKRLVRFPSVNAKEFRLVIEESRLNPTISELGLYKSPVEIGK